MNKTKVQIRHMMFSLEVGLDNRYVYHESLFDGIRPPIGLE